MQVQQGGQTTLAGGQAKYREDDKHATNIMYDRRVVRGNTYAALVVPEDDPQQLASQRAAQRRKLKAANQRFQRPGTPEAVPGRHHMDVQTDPYLEELTQRATEFEAETQTDFLLDRPATPLYIPEKSGQDAATQIEDNDLFDFDLEVEPLLEVLVGKALERSMMEVLEEEELSAMRRHQEHFQQIREQELVEVQRMEAVENRRQEEISRRKEQSSARKQFDEAVMRKILSRNVARSYLSGLQNRCFDELFDAGVFHDSNLIAVEGMFLPWLLDSVKDRVTKLASHQKALESAVADVAEGKTLAHDRVLAVYEAERDELEAAERRIRAERDEENKIAAMEAARIAAEEKRIAEAEPEDWVKEFTCVEYNEEENLVTLDDESSDTTVPEELVEELKARVAAESEKEEKVPIFVKVNKTQKVVLEIIPAPVVEEEPPADEEAPPADE
ncbi:unnamed protein product [Amoebophrya sp. A120]|nr:unnamed protein product [Amoebophrya sp. A120]|eukprot:GSA120T00019571001.1